MNICETYKQDRFLFMFRVTHHHCRHPNTADWPDFEKVFFIFLVNVLDLNWNVRFELACTNKNDNMNLIKNNNICIIE
jgi:hypothetical protein